MSKQVTVKSANGFIIEITHTEDGGILLVALDTRLDIPTPPIRFTAGAADEIRSAVAKEDA